MAVKGVFASDSNIQATRKGDFASALLQTMPTGSAPMLALSAGMPSRAAVDVVITWWEENKISGQNSVTNNAGTGTTLTMSDPSIITPGVVMWVPSTGEYLYVESISGADATVTRGFADTPITPIDGTATPVPTQRIGTAHEEGSDRPEAVANIGYPLWNFTQTFRNTWNVTGTAAAVEYHTGDVVAKNRRDALFFHSEDIEKSIIWGKLGVGVKNGKSIRMMNGIQAQIITNQEVQGANVTWDILDAFLRAIFEVNVRGKPNERIGFCGNSVLAVLNRIARYESQYNIEKRETEFGLKIHEWATPYGDVSLMTHPLMVESPVWTEDLMVIHPGAVETRWLRQTSEDAYDRDGRRNGVDADYGVYTSELSISYKAEKTAGYFSGINTAAAST